jgi:hypothetical protein
MGIYSLELMVVAEAPDRSVFVAAKMVIGPVSW